MPNATLLSSLDELANRPVDVLIVGSGPAGVATAEFLSRSRCDWTIGMVERGSLLTLTHINNIFPNSVRRDFIDRFKINPWEGSFRDGGMLLPALGGRGIVAGAHLRRFDPDDFFRWRSGAWPIELIDRLPYYYREAEITRRVNVSAIRGRHQTWALSSLDFLHAHPPTIGVDLPSGDGFDVGHGYDSSAARLWQLLIDDTLANDARNRRILVTTGAYAIRIEHHGGRVNGVRCLGTRDHRPTFVAAGAVVLAAGAIESARLCLLSGVDQELPATGRFLAEHIERRSKIEIESPAGVPHHGGISLVVPPQDDALLNRFQIHLRGQSGPDGRLEVDIGGFAAMDPSPENRVTLAKNRDEFDIPKAHTQVSTSSDDQARTSRMCERIREIASILGGRFVTARFPFEEAEPSYVDDDACIQEMSPGRSYHEAGTLRMGMNPADSATDAAGRVHGFTNLHVADAALFPCVGVANPMLTITALAYHVADRLAGGGGEQPTETPAARAMPSPDSS